MLVLSIDTATPAPAVAICGDGEEREIRLPIGASASEALLPAIARLVPADELSRIDRIAVAAGPGSFTGIRVGLATAWGLSRALRRPLEAANSLEAVAETTRATARVVWAVIPSERGQVYAGRFDLTENRAAVVSPASEISAEELERCAAGELVAMAEGSGPSPALALARACRRQPGKTTDRPEACYIQRAAAEVRHGVAPA
jgi:tRNA threonylcarbamoyladenosine biosynthesis protein TsaB